MVGVLETTRLFDFNYNHECNETLVAYAFRNYTNMTNYDIEK